MNERVIAETGQDKQPAISAQCQEVKYKKQEETESLTFDQ